VASGYNRHVFTTADYRPQTDFAIATRKYIARLLGNRLQHAAQLTNKTLVSAVNY